MKHEKTFMGGVLLLSVSALAAKVCGVIFKIPLYAVIGDDGMGYFNSAYVIYTFFHVFTTSGLPVGLSLLVSEAPVPAKQRLWKNKAVLCFGSPALIICLVMMIFPDALASAAGNPGAGRCIFVMGPALLFVCLEGVLRGFFQGKKNMLPTAVSQVIEAVFKTGLGLWAAERSVQRGDAPAVSAAWALSGVAVGSFAGLIFLLISCIVDRKKEKGTALLPVGRPVAVSTLLKVVMPVSLASVVLSVSSVIDLYVIMHRLQDVGFTAAQANGMYGNYSGLALPFFHLPSVLIAPIASALVPHLKSARSNNDALLFSRMSEAAIRLSILASLPFVVGFLMMPSEILGVFFRGASVSDAAPLLALLAPSVVLVSFTTVSASCLQSAGHGAFPVFSLFFGALSKIAVGYFLIPQFSIAGAPVGTFVCSLIGAVMNAVWIRRSGLTVISLKKTLFRPLWSALLSAGAVFLAGMAAEKAGTLPKLLICAAVGAAVYFLLLPLFGCVDEATTALMPALSGYASLFGKRKGKI